MHVVYEVLVHVVYSYRVHALKSWNEAYKNHRGLERDHSPTRSIMHHVMTGENGHEKNEARRFCLRASILFLFLAIISVGLMFVLDRLEVQLKSLRDELQVLRKEELALLKTQFEDLRRNLTDGKGNLIDEKSSPEKDELARQLANLTAVMQGKMAKKDELVLLKTQLEDLRRNLTDGKGNLIDEKSSKENKTILDGPVRMGNRILNLWTTSLPVTGGYATGYLHIRTNMVCGKAGVHDMYNFRLTGHLFRSNRGFQCQAFGYVSPSGYINTIGLAHKAEWCNTDQNPHISLQVYCAPNSKDLVLKLADSNVAWHRWHASGLAIDFMGNPSPYMARTANYIRILDAEHNEAEQVSSW